MWGLLPSLAIKVNMLEPGFGRRVIVLNRYAIDLMKQGKNEEALDVYEEMLEMGLALDATLSNLAHLKGELGDNKGRIVTLQKLCQASPDSLGNRAQLAEAYARDGDLINAEKTYRQAIDLKPGAYLLNGEFATFLLNNGREAEGIEWLEAFIAQHEPTFPLPYFHLIEHLFNLGQQEKASEVLNDLKEKGFRLGRRDTEKLAELELRLSG